MESKRIFEEIKKSMGDFPPFFPEYRNQKSTNCYAHALGLHYPDKNQNYYCPGKITALFNGSDIFDDYEFEETLSFISKNIQTGKIYSFTPFEIDCLIKGMKRDCTTLGLHAIDSDFLKPSSSHSYKVLLYTDSSSSGWYFVRESSTLYGKKIWTHKPGWYTPIQELDLSRGHVSFCLDDTIFKFRKCFEVFF